MALMYFQNWAIAFRTKPDLYYLPNVYNELKREGKIYKYIYIYLFILIIILILVKIVNI